MNEMNKVEKGIKIIKEKLLMQWKGSDSILNNYFKYFSDYTQCLIYNQY